MNYRAGKMNLVNAEFQALTYSTIFPNVVKDSLDLSTVSY